MRPTGTAHTTTATTAMVTEQVSTPAAAPKACQAMQMNGALPYAAPDAGSPAALNQCVVGTPSACA
jgi:hypothetical protein